MGGKNKTKQKTKTKRMKGKKGEKNSTMTTADLSTGGQWKFHSKNNKIPKKATFRLRLTVMFVGKKTSTTPECIAKLLSEIIDYYPWHTGLGTLGTMGQPQRKFTSCAQKWF